MPKIKHTEEKKLAVVLEGLKGNGSIAELSRRHGISDALYYRWRDQFVEGGKRALSGKLTFTGTRIMVWQVLKMLTAGETVEEILEPD